MTLHPHHKDKDKLSAELARDVQKWLDRGNSIPLVGSEANVGTVPQKKRRGRRPAANQHIVYSRKHTRQ